MRFETIALDKAQGAILAHTIKAGGRAYKKGRTLSLSDIAALREAGIASVMGAVLEPGDVGEDEAALRISRVLGGEGLRKAAAFTGRANLYAEAAGLAVIDTPRVHAANLVNEAITIATLPPFAPVQPGEMVATVKIIPFSAKDSSVRAVEDLLPEPAIRVAKFQPLKVALISTEMPGGKASLIDKNRESLEARLAPMSGALVLEKRTAHDAASIAAALREAERSSADLLFVFGASAITDRRDAIPAGIEMAGGQVLHFGMPVDPGNLLLLGKLGSRPVVGLPGCARSPKLNGFDFVLQRLFAGLDVTREDLMRMGVGGLLSEIPTRPQPRESNADAAMRAPKIAAIVLAAGKSSRMGKNKLLEPWRGKPLVRHVAEHALVSHAHPVIVVTGHEAARTKAALAGLDVRFADNAHYAEGLSASLRAGLRAIPGDCDGALVLLGDMPEIEPAFIDKMIAAFSPADGRAIAAATREGKHGNPVLWARRFFGEMETLTGDIGAKHLLALYDDLVCDVEAPSDAVFADIDTPDALAALQKR